MEHQEPLSSRKPAFIVVLIAGFITLLDVSIVNVALPSIEEALHATATQIQWVVAGYSLTFGLLLAASGRAGDLFGRRRLFIIGILGFVFASLGCGLAPTAMWLVILRLIQGMFAGVLNPQILGLIQDLFVGKERARAFGGYGLMIGISTAVGPLLGGALLTAFGAQHGWRLVFLINVPIGLVVAFLAHRWLPRHDVDKEEKAGAGLLRQFDPVGVIVLGVAVVLVMWPFLSSSHESGGTLAQAPMWLLIPAAVLLAALFLWEKWWHKRGGMPLMDPRLIKNLPYMLGVTTGFVYFAGFTSIFIVLTLYLQQGLGFTPLEAGLAGTPFALVSGASSALAGRLVNRFGRNVPLVGSSIVFCSLLAITLVGAFATESIVPWVAIALLGIAGIGSGLIISPNQVLTLDNAPKDVAGVAAALLQTLQRVGTAIGLAIVTTVFFVAVDSRMEQGKDRAFEHGFTLALAVVTGLVLLTVIVNLVDKLVTPRYMARKQNLQRD